jgi:catechol 2,3-dioxygenase-like lactoylglutathione lyase family enzyme
MYDPYGNLFQIEEDDYVFSNTDKATGGVNGVIIGVTDMDKSINFYGKLVGYDTIVYDRTDIFSDLKGIPGGERKVRRVLLRPSAPMQGPLCEIMGISHIELVQLINYEPKKLFEGRWWGDPGFIHLCFDIRRMEGIKKVAESLGHPFVCDSGADFKMGEADGHFTYVEDPDGTLIEFVETYKIPVIKKLGLYLHLANKDDRKPLPRYITKALRFLKVKG